MARRPWLVSLAIVLVGVVVAGTASFLVAREQAGADRDRFDRDSAVLAKAVESETEAIFDQIAAAGAFFSLPPRPTQAVVADYLDQLALDETPWLRDLGWAEVVPAGSDLEAFEARERRDNTDFRLRTGDGERERDHVVLTRGATDTVSRLIGLDVTAFGTALLDGFDDPFAAEEPFVTAIAAPAAALINRVEGGLQVEAGNLIGLLPTRGRDGRVTGWVVARINPDQLLGVDGSAAALRARLELTEELGSFSETLVAETGVERAPENDPPHELVRTFSAGEITWRLTLSSSRENSPLPALVLVLGIALTLAVALVALARRRADEVAGRLTVSEQRLREDSLTGLPNRLGLEEALGTMIAANGAEGRAATLFLDIDRFKLINDSLGHAAGDELLAALAERLTGAIRRGDTVGRFGGDEFLVLIAEIEDAADAEAQARRVMGELDRPLELSFGETQVQASIGIRVIEGDDDDPGGVIRDADLAMFAAKRSGDGIQVFDSAMRQAAGDRLILERALLEAVAAGDLRLEYQPIVNEDGVLVAVEGLLRWQHPELGNVPPAHFLPVAEEVGLMPEIGRHVVREAISQAARWNDRFDQRIQVAVNVTGAELYDPDFPDFLHAELRHHRVGAEQIMLEISEELLLEAAGPLQDALARLREIGVGLALDDFGTGRSSLSQARQLSTVTEFKLDCSLVIGVDQHEGRVIVRAASDLAAGLGQQVVAEGIEQPAQRDYLLGLGITRFQGFLYSPSVPASRISGWLADGARLDKDDLAARTASAQPSS